MKSAFTIILCLLVFSGVEAQFSTTKEGYSKFGKKPQETTLSDNDSIPIFKNGDNVLRAISLFDFKSLMPAGSADNLGNHSATQALDMNQFLIDDLSLIEFDSSGGNRIQQGFTSDTNYYFYNFIGGSAASFNTILDKMTFGASLVEFGSLAGTGVRMVTVNAAGQLSTQAITGGLGADSFVKENVVVATTGNITLSGLQTIEGNTLTEGERVLVMAQTDASENGIYTASSGAWPRAADANSTQNLSSAMVYVYGGIVNWDKIFITSFNGGDVIGVDDVIFTEFDPTATGSGDVTAASNFGTDNVLLRSDGTTKGVQASGISISDLDEITGVRALHTTVGNVSAGGNVYGNEHWVRPISSPTNNNDGNIYYDIDTHQILGRINGVYVDLGASGGFGNPATSDLAMADFDITNIGEIYINGTSTDNDDFIFGRSDSGSYFYDEDAYNNLVKGRFDIAAATGNANYEGDFNINGELTINGVGVGSTLGEENATATRNAALSDADGFVNVNSASDVTITIPTNATTAFPVGTVLSYFQEGTGDIIIAYSGGVTGEEARTFNTGHKIVLWKTGTDVWQVISRPASALVTSAEYTALSTALKNNGTLYGTSD